MFVGHVLYFDRKAYVEVPKNVFGSRRDKLSCLGHHKTRSVLNCVGRLVLLGLVTFGRLQWVRFAVRIAEAAGA